MSPRAIKPIPFELIDKEDFYKRTKYFGDCIVWHCSRNYTGYGRYRFGGVSYVAHRVSWSLENGAIPEGMFVCHKCDNPPCVNPKHLFIGTAQDNSNDMCAKNRQRGTKRKLDSLTRKKIIQRLWYGTSKADISRKLGVSLQTIDLVQNNVYHRIESPKKKSRVKYSCT